MQPLVSILIPCYNAAPWLAQTLESALAQTWPRTEIIVVNDGSKDASGAIARNFVRRGVTVIDQPNEGQSAAFNRALAAARGDFLEFLDADDLLAPDKIAQQVTLASTLPPGRILSGAWGRFHDNPAAAEFRPDTLWSPSLDPVDWLIEAWTNGQMMHGAAWLIPAPIVRRAGGWNASLSVINDFEFFSRQLLHGERVHFCAAARSYYRSGLPGSLSGRRSAAAWKSAFESLSQGTAGLLEREDSPRTRLACARVFAAFYYDAYPAVPDLRNAARRRVAELGDSLGTGPGGPKFQLLARCVGWRTARRLQIALVRPR